MNPKRTITTLIAVAVLLAGLPAGAAAATGDLAVDVTQNDDGSATVTVTDNGSAAANATVGVEASDSNDTYAGEGTYEAGENGTVSLPAPGNGSVNVTVTATLDNDSATTTTTLEAATENETDEETEAGAFGMRVQSFVQELLDGGVESGIGQEVSAFVTANNPGADDRSEKADEALNASDDRDKPADAGSANDSDDAGQPDDVGNDSDEDEDDDDDEDGDESNGKAKGAN
jgi:hypothetical protein